MTAKNTITTLPIHWFGNRPAYEASPLRVVTVGLFLNKIKYRNT
jgi:hypothetical protein